MDAKQIGPDIHIGAQPAKEQIQELQAAGVKTVINLRVERETSDQLDPVDEGTLVRDAGMEYLHIPVISSQIREGQVDEFRNAVSQLPKPIFVHCQKGGRAGILAVMDQAVRNRWSGKEAISQAREAGVRIDDPALEKFVSEYVDSRKS